MRCRGMVRRGLLVILGGALLSLPGGCSEKKGLYGLEVGMREAAVKAAFVPAVAGGTWAREGEAMVIGAPAALPSRVVVVLKDGKVASVRMRFDRAGIVAGDENPVTFPETLRKKQIVEGQAAFEHAGTKVWVGPARIRTFSKEKNSFTIERFSRAMIGAGKDGCEAGERMATTLFTRLQAELGEGGARTREARAKAAAALRPLAAAAELACAHKSGVLTAVAEFFRRTGAANGARARYLKALKTDDGWGALTRSDAHAGIGALAFRYRKDAEAAEHYALAIRKAGDAAVRARVARAYADDLHRRERYQEAATYYQTFLENTASADPSDLSRVNARLLRAMIEQKGGCEKAPQVARRGLALEGAKPEARAAMLAAEAFRIIACEPRKKKRGYARLAEAVKLDPLMAAEWSRLTAYYDREAQDETVLKIMVDQGWLDPKGLNAARAYQKEIREEHR